MRSQDGQRDAHLVRIGLRRRLRPHRIPGRNLPARRRPVERPHFRVSRRPYRWVKGRPEKSKRCSCRKKKPNLDSRFPDTETNGPRSCSRELHRNNHFVGNEASIQYEGVLKEKLPSTQMQLYVLRDSQPVARSHVPVPSARQEHARLQRTQRRFRALRLDAAVRRRRAQRPRRRYVSRWSWSSELVELHSFHWCRLVSPTISVRS